MSLPLLQFGKLQNPWQLGLDTLQHAARRGFVFLTLTAAEAARGDHKNSLPKNTVPLKQPNGTTALGQLLEAPPSCLDPCSLGC